MMKYDLVAPCSDYCGGCGQYNGLVIETAKQMREFADLYGFEFRSEGAFNFKQFMKGLEWFIDKAKCPGCARAVSSTARVEFKKEFTQRSIECTKVKG